MFASSHRSAAFTLIELLIVVAIIAILAAIAVPNFLEAQTRSKVSRAKADMRSVATAIEAYAVDHNHYPIHRLRLEHGDGFAGSGGINMVTDLSTPIAYMTSVSLADPFKRGPRDSLGWVDTGEPFSYMYVQMKRVRQEFSWTSQPGHWAQWMMLSYGPDKKRGPDPHGIRVPWQAAFYAAMHIDTTGTRYIAWEYDPTNGTVSNGDVTRWQGGR